ncbi:signal peptidase I [Woodsholea maritima]|uniref:signal peptidase I n=1 Tax=Woodsholea maritima TaxID=240237 RepID=UPI000371EAF0|nr:signal peptidase I [Woodsholea maritima]
MTDRTPSEPNPALSKDAASPSQPHEDAVIGQDPAPAQYRQDASTPEIEPDENAEGDEKSFVQRMVGEAIEVVRFLGGVAAVWLALVTFGYAAFHIPSVSMQPTLEVGDRVVVSKWAYGYSRHSLPLGLGYWVPESVSGRFPNLMPKPGDVVVVRDPSQHLNLIKRVVGLPGDVIEVRGGRLFINNEVTPRELTGEFTFRDYRGNLVSVSAYDETLPNGRVHPIYEHSDHEGLDNVGPFQVPEHHIFVMGDNRDSSADSRVNYVGPDGSVLGLGYVHVDELVGRAETVLFTFANCRQEEGLHCPKGRVWRPLVGRSTTSSS